MSDDTNPPLGPRGDAEDPSASVVGPRSADDVVDAALRMVTALTRATLTNADGVSVTLERHGQLVTVAASDERILEMDRHQYATGEGPCLSAKSEAQWFYAESLDEETRWPTFVPRALAQGIRSILSSPLMTANRPHGALNIYSNTVRAFGEHEQALAALFATQASQVLTTAGVGSDEHLATALHARQMIARAEGVIMVRQNLSSVGAVALLRDRARDGQMSVLRYATQLVASLGEHDGSED